MALIELQDVWKSYNRAASPTLQGRLRQWFSRSENKMFWALQEVSFRVHSGEVLGIVGANGAGKTTILRLLARITVPTKGQVRVQGRATNLIDPSAGFHPELTGGENVFLQGALLGMRRHDIKSRYESITAFAGIRDFMDTPTKKYSSGMLMRLGFSIAIHTEPDVLLVDEALSVGDTAFQSKCLDSLQRLRDRGVATVFVSHNLPAISAFADRVIWLHKGRVRQEGSPSEVVESYLSFHTSARQFPNVRSLSPLSEEQSLLRSLQVRLLRNGTSAEEFEVGDPLTVEVDYDTREALIHPCVAIGVYRNGQPIFDASMHRDGQCPERLEGEGSFSCTFQHLPLLPGTYEVMLHVGDREAVRTYLPNVSVGTFRIVSPLSAYGFAARTAPAYQDTPPFARVPYVWKHGKAS